MPRSEGDPLAAWLRQQARVRARQDCGPQHGAILGTVATFGLRGAARAFWALLRRGGPSVW